MSSSPTYAEQPDFLHREKLAFSYVFNYEYFPSKDLDTAQLCQTKRERLVMPTSVHRGHGPGANGCFRAGPPKGSSLVAQGAALSAVSSSATGVTS